MFWFSGHAGAKGLITSTSVLAGCSVDGALSEECVCVGGDSLTLSA